MSNFAEVDPFLAETGRRKLLIVEGSEQFVADFLSEHCDFFIDESNFKTYSKSYAHLGNEYCTVGYNACCRINPEILYSLGGLIKFGGTLVLGVRSFEKLDECSDRDLERFRADKKTVLKNNFLFRMKRIIEDSGTYAVYSETSGFRSFLNAENNCGAQDRERFIDEPLPAEYAAWLDSDSRLLVISGKRGSGKSTLLGKISRHVKGRVLISAPSRASLTSFYRIASNAEFVGIEQLLETEPGNFTVLVDEISSIPVYQLRQIAERFSKVVLSGTAEGYEGTARGIKLKLLPYFETHHIDYRMYELHGCHRNDETDSFGRTWRQIFNPGQMQENSDAGIEQTEICTVTGDELLQNEQLLSEIYRVLSNNHYQSQPSDLRQILDVPDNIVVYLKTAGVVAGVMWCVREQIAPKIVPDVFLGTRRPRGNIIPQTLVAHSGFKNAGYYRFLRIVRVAVMEKYRRRKFGSMLVSHVYEHCREMFDYLGVSFGITLPLVRFWKANGFTAVKLGMKEDHVTGLYSVVMLRSGGKLLNRVMNSWYGTFMKNLMFQASWQYRDFEPQLLTELVDRPLDDFEITSQYWRDLESVALGHRSPEQAVESIIRWILGSAEWRNIPFETRSRLFAYFVMHQDADISGELTVMRQQMLKTLQPVLQKTS